MKPRDYLVDELVRLKVIEVGEEQEYSLKGLLALGIARLLQKELK